MPGRKKNKAMTTTTTTATTNARREGKLARTSQETRRDREAHTRGLSGSLTCRHTISDAKAGSLNSSARLACHTTQTAHQTRQEAISNRQLAVSAHSTHPHIKANHPQRGPPPETAEESVGALNSHKKHAWRSQLSDQKRTARHPTSPSHPPQRKRRLVLVTLEKD